MKLNCFVYTNQGGRGHNEDAVGEKKLTDGGLYVLADGLGGHKNGEIASECVVHTILNAPDPEAEEDIREWFQKQFDMVNENICSLQKEYRSNMHSTAVVLRIDGEHSNWAHLGDSRLYYLHRGRILSITEDHSVAYKKYKAGEITRAQINTDEDQSSLLRTLGKRYGCVAECECAEDGLESGDGFLLCSDGVWEYLFDDEVLIDFLKAVDARQWGELLLMRVIERIQPGNDNLSLITVCVE